MGGDGSAFAFGKAKVTYRLTEAVRAQDEARELATKQREEEARLRWEEETRRREEERAKVAQQIRSIVRLDGSYVPVLDEGAWRAIRFLNEANSVSEGIAVYAPIRAHVVTYSSQRGWGHATTGVAVNGSTLRIESMVVTVSKDKNVLQLQSPRGTVLTYVFNAHPSVVGKTYYNVNNTDQSISYFAGSERQEKNGFTVYRSDRFHELTYSYADGVITERIRNTGSTSEPVRSRLLWVNGPFLATPGGGPVWAEVE